jgi:hypothetical protein
MPLGIILFIITNGLIMVNVNPYGALIYSVVTVTWSPTAIEDLINITMIAYTVMLLSTLLVKGRGKS